MNNIIERLWNQNKMVQIEDLKGSLFQDESAGHTFKIYGIDDAGNTVALSGTPSGIFHRPDNTDVTLSCSVSGGVVSATLPSTCYDVPGRGGVTVFLTSDSQKTAIYAAVATVTRTESGTVAPPATQDVVDLINAISAAVATIPASYTDFMADIAPTYSSSSLYAVGQYAWYNGDLKRCIVPITTAESYTAAHWTSANLGNDVSDLKSAINAESAILDTTVGIRSYEWTKGIYFNTNTTTIDIDNPHQGAAYYAVVVPCVEGDVFHIKTPGAATTVRPWCFINSSKERLKTASANIVDTDITAPYGTAYLVCNSKDGVGTLVHKNSKMNIPNDKIALMEYEIKTSVYSQWVKDRRYETDGGTIDVSSPVYIDGWYCIAIPCQEKDLFRVEISTGNTTARPWAFIDSEGTIKSVSSVNVVDTSIIAPADAVYLICNCNSAGSNIKKVAKIDPDFVTPQMFGAVGDGVTDDTAAFQRAIDSGRTVFVPSNKGQKYRITDTLTIASGCSPKIYGDPIYTKDGISCILFDLTDSFDDNYPVLRKTALFNVTTMQLFRVAGLAFKSEKHSGKKIGLFMKAQTDLVDYDIDVSSCYIHNFYRVVAFKGRGFALTNSAVASVQYLGYFDWDDEADTNANHPPEYDQRAIRFQNNRLHHISRGCIYIRTGHAYGLTFKGNLLDNGSGYLIIAEEEAYNWHISDNLFQGVNLDGPFISFRKGARNCMIENNVFSSDLTYWLKNGESTVKPPENWILSEGTLEYCSIVGNNCKNSQGAALLIENANNNVVSSNIFQGIGSTKSDIDDGDEPPEQDEESGDDFDPETLYDAMIEISGTVSLNAIVGNIATGTNVTLVKINTGATFEDNQVFANIPSE